MQRDSRERARYFVLSFTASFFLISAFFFFLVSVVHPRASVVPRPYLVSEEEEPWKPGREDALTVLLMGCGTRGEAPGVYILARFAPEQGRVYLSALPADTLVWNLGERETMAEVYAYGGASYTRDRLAETLSLPIDRYIRMDADSFIRSAAAIGSVEFDLPVAMTLSEGEYVYHLEPGLQLLDGRKMFHILAWNGYGSEAERVEMAALLAAAAVEQRRDIAAATVADRVFETIINLIDTDLSSADYAPRGPAGDYLARLSGPVAEVIEVAGRQEEGGFALSDTFAAGLARAYG